MARYLEYLRKSRMDTDYEEASVEETLSRHRQILDKFCKEKKLNVVEVLEEVVSGESLASRPKMMRLLELVNTGMYDGVVCMDIERLSRGSSMESGYIMQVFQSNACKIITPGKTYDLQNESDEQFTDMKFMFSRYELKTINKRLVRGRNQSASEGKFMGSMAPYGYRAYKLPGEKGNSLQIVPEEAEVVRLIYDLYGQQGLGYITIARELNRLNIPSLNGLWGQTSIVNILNNEVYLGKIRWRHEPVKRIVKDGMLTKKRYLNEEYELYDGRHEAIITQEQWDLVKSVQASKCHTPTHTARQLRNPFATILLCEKCGAVMKRNVPSKKQNTSAWYRCPNIHCNTRTIKCDVVEQAVVDHMEEWLDRYIVNIQHNQPQTDTLEASLHSIQEKLSQLEAQQDKICEYLEKGVYTIETFTKRNEGLQKQIRKLQTAEKELLDRQNSSAKQKTNAALIIPTAQHILDNYDHLSVEEKNRLWKIVLEKATIYRDTEGQIHLHIYPRLPQ